MKLIIIAAVGKNGELGQDNHLIWHLPEDMKFFKDKTVGHIIVMGRKTFESLPNLLPDRKHIVISHKSISNPYVEVFSDISSFLNKYYNSDEQIFNIGGATMYKALLDYTDEIYLTEIDASSQADVYFPKFDKSKYNRQILYTKTDNETSIQYQHVLYKRR